MEQEDIIRFLEEKKPLIDSVIKKYVPEKWDRKFIDWAFGKPGYAYNAEALEKALAEPIWDFLKRGGKRWRPALLLLIVEALGGDVKKAKELVVIPELLHNGSIMVDDIEDNSELRRGQPCTHKKFGIDIAINAGNAMYFLPLLSIMKNQEKLGKETTLRLWNACIQEMINIHFGQGSDIVWHKGLANADKIAEEEYLQMCTYKTGCLSRLASRMGAILSGAPEKTEQILGKFAETIGIAFQIRDDILNITGDLGKEYGDDINEGKRTLMVIHTLKKGSDEDRKELLRILGLHTKDKELIKKAIDILKKYNSVEYAKGVAEKMVKGAWKDVDKLLEDSEAKEMLKAFASFAVEREI